MSKLDNLRSILKPNSESHSILDKVLNLAQTGGIRNAVGLRDVYFYRNQPDRHIERRYHPGE